MKTRNRNRFWVNSLFTATMFLFISALLVPAGAQEIETENTRLSFVGLQPSIYGNIIVARTHRTLLGPIPIVPISDFPVDANMISGTDAILVYYDVSTGTLYNTGAQSWTGTAQIWGDKIVFSSYEGYISKDLNGDGDVMDHVVRYFDIPTQKVFSTKAVTSCGPSLCNYAFSTYDNIIAYKVAEATIKTDTNNDGDLLDMAVRYYDINDDTLHETAATFYSQGFGAPAVSRDIIAFSSFEREEGGIDFNGDGDANDMILRYYDLKNKKVINTKAEIFGSGFLDVSGSVIAFLTSEVRPGIDLNGDGDTSDYIVRYYDVSTGQLVNTKAEAHALGKIKIKDNIITFLSPESSIERGQDLNGDGDTSDNILRYYDTSTGRLINTGAEIFSDFAPSNGKVIAFISSEAFIGKSGADLNGDGDNNDTILRYYDLAAKTLINTKAEAGLTSMLNISNNIIAFGSPENMVGRFGEDLNGDGDKIDIVLRYIPLGPILPPPPLASFTATPTSGEAPLTVQFTDTSTNSPISWQWDFDNNGSVDSTQQNHLYTYTAAGTYTVSLTVSNQSGSNTKTAPNYITVTAPDVIPPNISITAPLDNATVKDTIAIKVSASDDRGVNRVEFYLDNTFHSADNTSPYEYFWDTQTVSDSLYSIKVKAYDEAGNSAEDNIAVRVNNTPPPVNHPPELQPIGNQTIDEGEELRFTVFATDPDGDNLSYSASNLPAGATFDVQIQTFFWKPAFHQTGSYSVTFTVDDLKGGIDSETITITVQDVNRAPILGPIGNRTVDEGKLLSFTLTASDPDGDSLGYSASNLPAGVTFAAQTQTFSWRPNNTQAGTYPGVHFTVSDGKAAVSEDITITVIDVPEPESEELSLEVNLKRNNCKLALELIARSSLQPSSKLSYRLKNRQGITLKTGQLFFRLRKGYYSTLIGNLPLVSYTIEIESNSGAKASLEIDPLSQPDSLNLNLNLKPQGRRVQLNLEVATVPFHPDNCLHYSLKDKPSSRPISQGHLFYKRGRGVYTKTLSLVPGDYHLSIETNYGGRLEQGLRVE